MKIVDDECYYDCNYTYHNLSAVMLMLIIIIVQKKEFFLLPSLDFRAVGVMIRGEVLLLNNCVGMNYNTPSTNAYILCTYLVGPPKFKKDFINTISNFIELVIFFLQAKFSSIGQISQ